MFQKMEGLFFGEVEIIEKLGLGILEEWRMELNESLCFFQSIRINLLSFKQDVGGFFLEIEWFQRKICSGFFIEKFVVYLFFGEVYF